MRQAPMSNGGITPPPCTAQSCTSSDISGHDRSSRPHSHLVRDRCLRAGIKCRPNLDERRHPATATTTEDGEHYPRPIRHPHSSQNKALLVCWTNEASCRRTASRRLHGRRGRAMAETAYAPKPPWLAARRRCSGGHPGEGRIEAWAPTSWSTSTTTRVVYVVWLIDVLPVFPGERARAAVRAHNCLKPI
jgi:hypothetical protein